PPPPRPPRHPAPHLAALPLRRPSRARMNTRVVERLAVSPDEAAAAVGVSRDYLHDPSAGEPRWGARPRAPAALGGSRDYLDDHIAYELRWVRRGRQRFVAVKELERWLDEAGERVIEGGMTRPPPGLQRRGAEGGGGGG